jgi:hypothetical protein
MVVKRNKGDSSWESEYVAVIADMVGSRTIPAERRDAVQKSFTGFVDSMNQRFGPKLKAKFIITLGDEFQGIFSDATALPDFLWEMDAFEFENAEIGPLRVGVGLGPLSTEIPEYAINVDGPALHLARKAISSAKTKHFTKWDPDLDRPERRNRMGGVFLGFGGLHDVVLNGLARMLWQQRRRWKADTRRVASLLRTGLNNAQISRRLSDNKETKLSQRAVGDAADRASWKAYAEGELALRAALELAMPKRWDE